MSFRYIVYVGILSIHFSHEMKAFPDFLIASDWYDGNIQVKTRLIFLPQSIVKSPSASRSSASQNLMWGPAYNM